MADHLPKFLPGASVTFTAQGDVVGGQTAAVGTGDRTAKTAAAGDIGIGTFAFNAADGNAVTVHLGALVDKVVVAGAVAVGDEVEPAAGGKVQALTTGKRFGVALTAGAADGDTIELARI